MGVLNRLNALFSAGAFGGMLNCVVVWFFGVIGVNQILGVDIAPAFIPEYLYPRIVWGGIWGIILLLPFYQNKLFIRGLLLSLGPTLVQLFIVFPLKAGKGIMGLELGKLTPVLVVIFNAAWGIGAAWWYHMSVGKKKRGIYS
jgi:hypothetical protein